MSENLSETFLTNLFKSINIYLRGIIDVYLFLLLFMPLVSLGNFSFVKLVQFALDSLSSIYSPKGA